MSQRQLPALVESLRTGGDVERGRSRPVSRCNSEDEIGELAQAFNDVEAVTMQVAQEQSRLLRKGMGDLFVNLARRNQSLLERQLELLDELERNEHDPAALDALFKLDHMATRMRRNAESLLVLSGAEQPRQWQQPIALIDVVRAAAAEIADFPRVELVGIDDDLAVSGRAVVRRRPPPRRAARERDVVLAARRRGRRLGRGVARPASCSRCPTRASACRPSGSPRRTSCSPSRPSSASRCRGRSACTWSASLAARHGIRVELRPGAPRGLVALVTLPTAVLEPRAVPAPPTPPQRPVYAPDPVGSGTDVPLGAQPGRLAPTRRASGRGVAPRGHGRSRPLRARLARSLPRCAPVDRAPTPPVAEPRAPTIASAAADRRPAPDHRRPAADRVHDAAP